MLRIILALGGIATLSGCAVALANAVAVGTPEEIKRSEYTTQVVSAKPLAVVAECMKGALQAAKSGSRPALVTYRDIGPEPYQFIVTNNVPTTWSGMRPEILSLLESSGNAAGGTRTQIWAHPRLIGNGGGEGQLARTVALVQPCMG